MRSIEDLKRLFSHFRHQGLVQGLKAAYDKVYRWITGSPIIRYSMIDERILIGGQPRKAGLRKLIRNGVTGIINMRSEYTYTYHSEVHEVHILLLPTDDNAAPSIEHLEEGVIFIRECTGEGGKVYIHCWEGLGRSATMAAAYYVSEGKTPGEAWEYIKRRRSFVRPTASQLQRLEEFWENLAEGFITTQA